MLPTNTKIDNTKFITFSKCIFSREHFSKICMSVLAKTKQKKWHKNAMLSHHALGQIWIILLLLMKQWIQSKRLTLTERASRTTGASGTLHHCGKNKHKCYQMLPTWNKHRELRSNERIRVRIKWNKNETKMLKQTVFYTMYNLRVRTRDPESESQDYHHMRYPHPPGCMIALGCKHVH